MDKDLEGRLREAGQDLNQWSDHLNKRWREIEDIVIAMNVGSDVAVRVKTVEPDYALEQQYPSVDLRAIHMLGFRKLDEGWCICYGMGPGQHESEYWEHPWGWKPIATCSRERRIDAAFALPDLLTRLREAAEARAAEVEQAVAVLNEAKVYVTSSVNRAGEAPPDRIQGMKVKEVISLIEADGWRRVKSKGGHRQYKHPVKHGRVTVSGKGSDTLAPKTLKSILGQAQLEDAP